MNKPTDSPLPLKKFFPTFNSRNPLIVILRWLGAREFLVLATLFTIMLSLCGFAALTRVALEQSPHEFDRTLLLSMRNPADLSDPIGPRWVEEIGRDITALGGNAVLIMLTLAVMGYLLLIKKPRLCGVVVIATLGALSVNSVLKQTIDRHRPNLVPHGSYVYTSSFPSGHAMLAASTYLTLGALLAQWQRRRIIKAYILMIAISITLLVGMSRIYLGVHWPSDVLAGWALGSGWALACWLLARRLQTENKTQNSILRIDQK